MTTIWTKAYQHVERATRIVVVAHPRPDGDAIGSLLGIANALRILGKDVTPAVDGGVPDFLAFLPYADTVLAVLQEGEWDLLITTDCADLERTGAVGEYARQHSQAVINIDHHPTNPRFGDVALVIPDATSAAEVVFDWFEQVGLTYDVTVSQPLLTGLVTDTQGFRISSTTPRTLEIAMKLMQRGASLTEVSARALESRSAREFELWKLILPKATIEGQVAYTTVTKADATAVGFDDTTDAGIVQYLININEAMIAAVFKERDNQQVGISLRAKRGYDVASVVVPLGGGGHIQAAGATVNGTLDEVQAMVLPLLHEAVAKGQLSIV